MNQIEFLILSNLLKRESYLRKVIPFLKEEYFQTKESQTILETIKNFLEKYNSIPTYEALLITIDNRKDLNEEFYNSIVESLDSMKKDSTEHEIDWLLDETEHFCKDRAIYNGLMQSVKIVTEESLKEDKGIIPKILTDALAVSFDSHIGHDFCEDGDDRYAWYHRQEEKIPFDLEYMNKITAGGLSKKTLNIFMAGCIHPKTKIKIRYKMTDMKEWSMEKEVTVQEVKKLLDNDYEVEVNSPDGYVPVTDYIDKGMWDEYILTTIRGKSIRCNENHLFETDRGWILAKNLLDKTFLVLGEDGFTIATVKKTEKKIPIVDITVDHPNHRYYTDGVSSHNTGVGKSLVMCHIASSFWLAGKNVLYITMEMSEERIAERIDANVLNMNIGELSKIPYTLYEKRLDAVKARTKGQLIIKEFPTAAAHVGHFRHLLNELKLKKKFIPDVVFIDYLNICCSSRLRGNMSNVNSYIFVKSIVEEIRGLAVEFDLPIISATQSNRAGQSDSEVDITNTSESFGTSQTVDLQIAVITSEELEQNGQFVFKQLKNRYGDVSFHRKFLIGVDKSKMKLFDVEETDQEDISKTTEDAYTDGMFAEREKEIKNENRFSGFKL